MSSNRPAMPSDAVVMRQDQPAGALLLPNDATHSFVAEFNRTYQSIGLSLSVTGNLQRADKRLPESPDYGLQ